MTCGGVQRVWDRPTERSCHVESWVGGSLLGLPFDGRCTFARRGVDDQVPWSPIFSACEGVRAWSLKGSANLCVVAPLCCVSKLVDDAPVRGIEDGAERGRQGLLPFPRCLSLLGAILLSGGSTTMQRRSSHTASGNSAGRSVGGRAFWRREVGWGLREGRRASAAAMPAWAAASLCMDADRKCRELGSRGLGLDGSSLESGWGLDNCLERVFHALRGWRQVPRCLMH